PTPSVPMIRATLFGLVNRPRRGLARFGPTTPKQVGTGNRSPVDGDKHTHSRGDARLLFGCFGRSDRSAQRPACGIRSRRGANGEAVPGRPSRRERRPPDGSAASAGPDGDHPAGGRRGAPVAL